MQDTKLSPAAPLSGYRVLELGSTVAGPFCGRLMADFGAEVIKVEPLEGDPVRSMGKRFQGKSLYASSIFRNKSLIAVDLHTREGQEIVKRLVAKCDCVIENFRPDTLDSWGLGYADLSAINPQLVMVRISGFGQTGPYSHRPGYGVIGEAVGGLRYLTGDPDRPPSRVAVSLTDYITGLYGAFGAVLAFLVCLRTGKGQYVDAALYECAFSFMEPHVVAYDKLGEVAVRAGSALPDSAPNNLYVTRDGQYILIAAISDAIFKRLTIAMGRPQLWGDDRFSNAVSRSQNGSELDDIIADWVQNYDLADLEEILRSRKIPACRIYTVADMFRDRHFQIREMLVPVPDENLGLITMVGVVPRLSGTPGQIWRSGGRIGEDTRRVLTEMAGYAKHDVDYLCRARVVGCDEQVNTTRESGPPSNQLGCQIAPKRRVATVL